MNPERPIMSWVLSDHPSPKVNGPRKSTTRRKWGIQDQVHTRPEGTCQLHEVTPNPRHPLGLYQYTYSIPKEEERFKVGLQIGWLRMRVQVNNGQGLHYGHFHG